MTHRYFYFLAGISFVWAVYCSVAADSFNSFGLEMVCLIFTLILLGTVAVAGGVISKAQASRNIALGERISALERRLAELESSSGDPDTRLKRISSS
jgi:hypothetical protein